MKVMENLTEHGHHHPEAFMLMTYSCRCGHREIIWNSRDGVTPFSMSCPRCKRPDMYHADFQADVYARNYQLVPGQRFWRDGTPDEAEAVVRERLDAMGILLDLVPERIDTLVAAARSGEDNNFQPGWPMIDRFRERAA